MARRLGFLTLLAILVAVPTAHAQDATTEVVSLDFDADEMVFRTNGRIVGADAADVRADIDDDYGNGDGTVTLDEVAAFNADSEETFTDDRPECFDDFELARIDDRGPARLSTIESSVKDATGKITSTLPIRSVSLITFHYNTTGSGPYNVVVQYDRMDSFGMAIGCYFSGWADSWDWEMPEYQGTYWPPEPIPTGPGACCASAYMAPQQSAASSDVDASDMEAELIMIQPKAGAKIDQASIQPATVRALWDGYGLRADTPAEQDLLFHSRVSFTMGGAAAASDDWGGTARDVGAYVGFATIGSSLVLLGLGLSTEFGRFQLLKFLFLIPGFSRLEKDEVLEHTRRDELYRFIKQNPGPSFSDLRRELSVSNGTLVHHLRILEAQEYVKTVRDGFRTRFYVRGPKVVVESYLTRTQQQLVDAISSNPGLTQKELAQVLGLPRESISYHTKQLAAKGRLHIKQEGKWRRYWPPAVPGGNVPTAV